MGSYRPASENLYGVTDNGYDLCTQPAGIMSQIDEIAGLSDSGIVYVVCMF